MQGQARINTTAAFAVIYHRQADQSGRPSGRPNQVGHYGKKPYKCRTVSNPRHRKARGFAVFKRRRHYPIRAFSAPRYTLCKLLLHNSNDFAQEAYNFCLSARVCERSAISRSVTMAGSPRCNVTTFAITACHHADKAPSHSLFRHCPCVAVCCVTKLVLPSRAILSFKLL